MAKTLLLKVDAQNPDPETISQAAEIIKRGGVVAFPTETVYGLGANALDGPAVQKIFAAKGRPSDNPLIVHIAEFSQLEMLVTEVPLTARRAMEVFWPGPLTIIMPCRDDIPRTVTGGLKTVGVRMPKHPVALALIKAAKLPIAAPSANSSGKPSPTEARHVMYDLAGKIDAVIDGGPAQVGVESTVLDMTGDTPVILRPGGVTREQLEAILGHVDLDLPSVDKIIHQAPKAPGMKYRHYSPEAKLILVKPVPGKAVADIIQALADRYQSKGMKVALMVSVETASILPLEDVLCGILGHRGHLEEIAGNLFKVLREVDAQKPDVIIAEGFAEAGIGMAIMNRLTKAASQVIDQPFSSYNLNS
ncbi:L-threonylcarbamoyladenylate synthase [Thermincola potens]|uniref:Threonylcarbamoyl-AMP synthase n=1 Tax=Thermincola potens (strain JR) TaxID=635013 RepID=D5XDI8_THEPJ|nr:L-threonylcarbamoyladenylate synthase [Thermincola potens]ADG83734.1 Sua5/YciO/YrdC/YwlC family protein [Thermincola potens JR]